MKKGVVLLSGGLDSTTALAIAKDEGFDVHALTVLYGQRHQVEIDAAKRIAKAFSVSEHRFVSVELNALGGSALTDKIDVPKHDSVEEIGQDIPVTYVPARNTIFLSLALAYAEVIGSSDIFIGVNAIDYSGYPDCRPEFIHKFEELARLATKTGVSGEPTKIHAPLIALTKERIINRGLELGVDYAMTHSCYDPDEQGHACGHCDSCLIRAKAFKNLDMTDPALAHLEGNGS